MRPATPSRNSRCNSIRSATRKRSRSTPEQKLYVGYFDSPTGASAATGQPDAGNEIAIFAQGASGSATPSPRSNPAARRPSIPASITFDAAGDLVTYGATTVDGSDGNDATLIYAPGASGSATPIHAWGFTSPYFHFPGPTGLELDAAGNFYVAGALKTSLSPQSGVFVAPASSQQRKGRGVAYGAVGCRHRTRPGQAGPIGLDASNEIYVSNFTRIASGGCQAQVNAYAAGSTGGTTDVSPLRVASIAGFATAKHGVSRTGQPPRCAFPGARRVRFVRVRGRRLQQRDRRLIRSAHPATSLRRKRSRVPRPRSTRRSRSRSRRRAKRQFPYVVRTCGTHRRLRLDERLEQP